jgi:hypothetical protein
MPTTKYPIVAFGETIPGSQAVYADVRTVGKTNQEDRPNILVNEFISYRLASALLLPVPPGFILESEGLSYFASPAFNLSGNLVQADVATMVKNHPELANGILLFDCWILNEDRSASNIAYDPQNKIIKLFDHGDALLAHGDSKALLNDLKDRSYLDHHCLASAIRKLNGMVEWNKKINLIPEFYIQETVQSARDLGLDETLASALTSFLLDRRKRLLDLLKIDKRLFTGLDENEWSTLK